MASYPNPLFDPRRRRRHRQGRASQQHNPLTTVATTAAVAYGAYRIGKWAYNSYFGVEEEDKEENYDGNDLLNQWTSDYQSNNDGNIRQQEDGFDYIGEISDANNNARMRHRHPSRRSRADWSNDRSKVRSNSPSPPQDYHNHTNNNQDDGMMKQSMKKAAAMASNGLGSAVSKGMSAGIHAYNKNNIPNNSITEQERRLRMGRCRLETSRAMIDFLPTLKKAVVKETDVSEQTDELKQLRIKKKEILEMKQNGGESGDIAVEEASDEEDIIREKERCLWNDIKNKSLTRLVTTIYAHTIIFLVLNVQVNLLGGQLLREELEGEGKKESDQQQSTKSSADQYRDSHQIVLGQTYHYLFAKGIPALAESVGKEVNEILQKWDVLGGDVKLTDVNSWIEYIRDKMEHQAAGGEMMSRLVEFVIPPEGVEDDANSFNTNETTDELAKYILDETYDLLESPAFAKAERQCLDTTFDHLRVKVLGKMYLMEDEIPLANVVTQLQKTAVSTFHKTPSHKDEMKSWGGILGMMEEPLPSAVPNDYISKLERLDTVQELSDVCF